MHQAPKLADVQAFVAVATTGSFAAAGKALGRDATVLSRSVQALERQLGVRLAERTTRVVALTEAGRSYLSRVAALLYEFEAANRDVAAFGDGEPHGRLKVALPGSFARLWMAPIITGFLEAYPQVVLEAHYSNNFVDLVSQGFDLAVRLAELADSRLIARKVASRRRLVCASPKYLTARGAPKTPIDLASHDCLCFLGRDDPYRWRFRNASGEEQSCIVTARVASDDADILVEAGVSGLGLLNTTDWHVGPLLAAGALVEVLVDWPAIDSGGVFIITSSSKHLPNKTRAFSDWVMKELSRAPWNESC